MIRWSNFFEHNPGLLREPTRREQLETETELFGNAVSGHPLELSNDIAWNTYCPVEHGHDAASTPRRQQEGA